MKYVSDKAILSLIEVDKVILNLHSLSYSGFGLYFGNDLTFTLSGWDKKGRVGK